jgi:two-component system, OmpR family, response regulator
VSNFSPADVVDARAGVLVVDDEPLVRDVLERGLRDHGFRVWSAGDGREALAVYRQHIGDIAAVVLDVNMPGPDGRQTARALRAVRAGIPCCFLSGDPNEFTHEELALWGPACAIDKPFRLEDVVACLGRILAGTGAEGREAGS